MSSPRRLARIALWLMLTVAFAQSASTTIVRLRRPPVPAAPPPPAVSDAVAAGFAVAFARAWLSWPAKESPPERSARLAPFLAAELTAGPPGLTVPADAPTQTVENAWPLAVRWIRPDRAVVEVALQLLPAQGNRRSVALAVPVAAQDGRLSVPAWPAPLPPPAPGRGDDASQGPAANPAVTVAARGMLQTFFAAYAAAKEPSDLANFLAPGAQVRPLGGLVAFRELAGVDLSGQEPEYRAAVTVRWRDPLGAEFLSAYDLILRASAEGRFAITAISP